MYLTSEDIYNKGDQCFHSSPSSLEEENFGSIKEFTISRRFLAADSLDRSSAIVFSLKTRFSDSDRCLIFFFACVKENGGMEINGNNIYWYITEMNFQTRLRTHTILGTLSTFMEKLVPELRKTSGRTCSHIPSCHGCTKSRNMQIWHWLIPKSSLWAP